MTEKRFDPPAKPQPNWLLDLVAAVEKYEDEHAKGDACFEAALFAVPDEVRIAAQAVANYRRDEPPIVDPKRCPRCSKPPGIVLDDYPRGRP